MCHLYPAWSLFICHLDFLSRFVNCCFPDKNWWDYTEQEDIVQFIVLIIWSITVRFFTDSTHFSFIDMVTHKNGRSFRLNVLSYDFGTCIINTSASFWHYCFWVQESLSPPCLSDYDFPLRVFNMKPLRVIWGSELKLERIMCFLWILQFYAYKLSLLQLQSILQLRNIQYSPIVRMA